MKRAALICLGALLLLGQTCRSDPGTPDYTDQVGLRDPVDPFPPVPPDPFQPGEERLAVGYFYEGGRSQTIPINGVTTEYFIFPTDDIEPVATATYSQSTSPDRLEGSESLEFTLNDRPFWGGGIIWRESIDISEWTTLNVGFKSSDDSFERFDLKLQWDTGRPPNEPPPEPLELALDPRDYGYRNDGKWHFLKIPLQDAIDRGFDPSNARSPFIIGGTTLQPGDVLLIDNLYFTKDVPGVPDGGVDGGMDGGIDGGIDGGTDGGTSDALYEQDFESLNQASGAALSDDGWVVFGNVFDSGGGFKFGYGPNPAPNGANISAVVSGQGGAEQGAQQLSIFSDYQCCQPGEGHFNGTDKVETNVFQEINPIPESFVGQTMKFSFDAKRGDIAGATTALAFIKTLDPNAGFATTNFETQDTTALPTTWMRYEISLAIDAGLAGQILQFGFSSTASNFEASGVLYDNIEVVLEGGGTTDGGTDGGMDGGTDGGMDGGMDGGVAEEYAQDFESLNQASDTALSDDGWVVFANVFDGGGGFKFGYGPNPAPNGGGNISGIVSGEGGAEQGAQQLTVFSDYSCCDLGEPSPQGHGNGTDRVEVNVFQEINPIPASFEGKTLKFSFDAKRGNLAGATTALAFIKTLDPNAGFATTNFVTQDTTGTPTSWMGYEISLAIDSGLVGQILQFGFSSTASNFEASGMFYDNIVVVLE